MRYAGPCSNAWSGGMEYRERQIKEITGKETDELIGQPKFTRSADDRGRSKGWWTRQNCPGSLFQIWIQARVSLAIISVNQSCKKLSSFLQT